MTTKCLVSIHTHIPKSIHIIGAVNLSSSPQEGNILLLYILFLIVVNTTWETKVKMEVKGNYTSSIMSNVICNFSSERVLLVASNIVNFIIVIVTKMLLIQAYKIKYLCDKVIYIANIIFESLKLMLIMPFEAFQEF